MEFHGKVAIVTGGAEGLGKAISTEFLNAGMKVLICDVSESKAKAFLQDLPDNLKSNVKYQKCDVSSLDEFRVAFGTAKSAYGKIDIVVNNAGIINESQWKRTVEINFIGVIHGIHLGFEFMGKHNGGSGGYIINIASNAGLGGFDLAPVYTGTKHGVVGLTRSYGQPYHFEKTGVTVNAVCPGAMYTQMYHHFTDATVNKKLATELLTKLNPLRPEEVAKAIIKLLQDGKNGALLSIDCEKGTRYEESRIV